MRALYGGQRGWRSRRKRAVPVVAVVKAADEYAPVMTLPPVVV